MPLYRYGTVYSPAKMVNDKPVIEVDGSAGGAKEITPSDSEIEVTKGVYIGTSGDLAVVMEDGSEVTFTALPAGVFHPLRVRKIKAGGTTASGIVGVY